MKALHDLYAFGLFSAYVLSGVGMLWLFTQAYIWRTPYDDLADIAAGKIGPAISLVGAQLGFVAPLLVASYVGSNYLDYLMWSALSGVFQMVWFELRFYAWGRREEIDPYNPGQALKLAGGSICVGLIQAFSMIP